MSTEAGSGEALADDDVASRRQELVLMGTGTSTGVPNDDGVAEAIT